MKTVQEVLSLALVEYAKNESAFMCHNVDDLLGIGHITKQEAQKTLDFISQTLEKRTTLTDYLFDNYSEYATLIGENHKYETQEALEYRVNWWRELIKTV